MGKTQEEFFRELLADFKIEAAEHHKAIIEGLLTLEKQSSPDDYKLIVETTFREFHSLKGAARAVNQNEIEKICMTVEGVFHKLKENKASLNPTLLELIFNATDVLAGLLTDIGQEKRNGQATNMAHILKAIENQLQHNVNQHVVSNVENSEITSSPVKIPFSDLPVIAQQEITTNELVQYEKHGQKETVRIATSKLNDLLRQTEEFVTSRTRLNYLIEQLQTFNDPEFQLIQRDFSRFSYSFGRMVDELLFEIKTTLLFPFSSLTDIIPKIVRDLSHEFNKEINLIISGSETEIDRRILEEMKDPLIHLIRNCIDHGIEQPEVRLKNGKPASGKIEINIIQESGRKVDVIITDDGAGIDRVKLKDSALKSSDLSIEVLNDMTDKEVLSLIFRSGITTSPMITDLSGRGLGMAIVASRVDALGGSISVESEFGQGTKFVISLPLTLSTFKGIVVKVNNQYFIIPTLSVEKAISINPAEIRFAKSKPFISRNGVNIALVNLADLLLLTGKQNKQNSSNLLYILILTLGFRKIGIIVDEILNEQEGIVKDLGPQLVHVNNIAGVTVLGNGQLIPILYIPELFESAVSMHSNIEILNYESVKEASETPVLRVLVAEDSITSRALIRNILETDGFYVKTAVDGLEAFHFLANEQFDIVVSDVEMPGMNGFELTAKIKSDNRFAHLPVILVTSLSTDSDKQRGLDAGANAYIVKSNFEQSNLVETIKRLI